MNFFSNIKSGIRIVFFLNRINRFGYKKWYKKKIFSGVKKSQYFFDSKHFSRGKQYVKSFGLMGLCLGDSLGRKVTNEELEQLILLSHIAPIYDDFFDKLNLPSERIEQLILNPTAVFAEKEEERLFLAFYIPLYHSQRRNPDFIYYFLKLSEAQEASKKQTDEGITVEEVEEITRNKGGFSCLLLRTLLKGKITKEEEQFCFQIGAMSQFMDDIFDWYDDTIEDRKTIANSYSIKELSLFYESEFTKTMQLLSPTHFQHLIGLLLAPAFICLNQFKSQNFDLQASPAKEKKYYICDMEKLQNMIQLGVRQISQ